MISDGVVGLFAWFSVPILLCSLVPQPTLAVLEIRVSLSGPPREEVDVRCQRYDQGLWDLWMRPAAGRDKGYGQ